MRKKGFSMKIGHTKFGKARKAKGILGVFGNKQRKILSGRNKGKHSLF